MIESPLRGCLNDDAEPGRFEVFLCCLFGLHHTDLILSWEPGSAEARRGGFHVEWSRPIGSQRPVQVFGMEMHLLKFDGIEESLLFIPLDGKRDEPALPQQVLATK